MTNITMTNVTLSEAPRAPSHHRPLKVRRHYPPCRYDALWPLLFVNPKRFPAWMFSTTRHHDDHHKHFQGNYGGYLAVWDVLMGTVIEPGTTSYRKKL